MQNRQRMPWMDVWAGGGLIGIGAGLGGTVGLLLFGADALALGVGAGAGAGVVVTAIAHAWSTHRSAK